jgi:hypothetical protein
MAANGKGDRGNDRQCQANHELVHEEGQDSEVAAEPDQRKAEEFHGVRPIRLLLHTSQLNGLLKAVGLNP